MASSLYTLRPDSRLPSRGRHALWALMVFTLITMLLLAYTLAAGDPRDARPAGEVELGALPPPERINDLRLADNRTEDLPVLFGEGEGLDLSGRPAGDRLGPRPPGGGTSASATPETTSGPMTIKINGQDVVVDQDGKPISGLPGASVSPGSAGTTSFTRPIQPLSEAPIPGYSVQGAFGPVPGRNAQRRTPFSAYSKPFTPEPGKQYVSIIVGGLGLNPAQTEAAITQLPAEVTLAFAPHVEGLQGWIDRARLYGHEVILELPMESYLPAEEAEQWQLQSSLDANENIRRLDYLMSRAHGYFAVTNYQGEKLAADSAALKPVMDTLYGRGISFVYDGETARSQMIPTARSANVPITVADSIIDVDPSAPGVRSQLNVLTARADSTDVPLGMGYGFDTTITAINLWYETMDKSQIDLAPASYVFKAQR